MTRSPEKPNCGADNDQSNPEESDANVELTGEDLESAAGGRLPYAPSVTSIPPPQDSYEPLSPSI